VCAIEIEVLVDAYGLCNCTWHLVFILVKPIRLLGYPYMVIFTITWNVNKTISDSI
jgi:hypothetical protein